MGAGERRLRFAGNRTAIKLGRCAEEEREEKEEEEERKGRKSSGEKHEVIEFSIVRLERREARTLPGSSRGSLPRFLELSVADAPSGIKSHLVNSDLRKRERKRDSSSLKPLTLKSLFDESELREKKRKRAEFRPLDTDNVRVPSSSIIPLPYNYRKDRHLDTSKRQLKSPFRREPFRHKNPLHLSQGK